MCSQSALRRAFTSSWGPVFSLSPHIRAICDLSASMLFRSFLASSTSLALLAATTLVHAAVSPIAGLSPGESAARASQPEANISERDLLERAVR